jgi:hypothetical protein
VKPKTVTRGPWPKEKFDPTKLKIANDPLPPTRTVPKSKYDELFSQLKPGQCIVCQPQQASRVGSALKKWLENRMVKNMTIRAASRYPKDDMGRVWLLNKESV